MKLFDIYILITFLCYFGDVEEVKLFLENYFFEKIKSRIIYKEKSIFSILITNAFGITYRFNYFVIFVILYNIRYC